MWKTFAALALGLVLASCDVSGFVPQDHQDFAKRVVALIQARDEQGLRGVCHPSIRDQLSMPLIDRMASFFPANETASNISVRHWKSNFTNDVSRVEIVMIYKYASRDVCVEMVFNSTSSEKLLTGVHVYPQGCPANQTPATPASPSGRDT